MESNETMKQLPSTIDVNGLWDSKKPIEFLGKATRQPNGKWHCLANVNGALCRVEVTITLLPEEPKMWKNGDRVYDPGGDFFGKVTEDEKDGKVLIKRDLPWDPEAPPEETSTERLEAEDVVRRRYNVW